MKHKEKGFTLLEAIISFMIFAIVLQATLNFFGTVYKNSKDFEKKSSLMDEARNVSQFIRSQIRQADKVVITYDDGTQATISGATGIESFGAISHSVSTSTSTYLYNIPYTSAVGGSSAANSISTKTAVSTSYQSVWSYKDQSYSGRLQKITLYTAGGVKQIILQDTSGAGKGKFKLVYDGGSGTTNLIADRIESFTISRQKNTDLIKFEVTYCKNGDTKIVIKDDFTETIATKN